MTRRYMDVNDVAEYLGFRVSYVRKLVEEGKLPYCRPFGKKLLFRVSDIDAIIERTYVPQVNEI